MQVCLPSIHFEVVTIFHESTVSVVVSSSRDYSSRLQVMPKFCFIVKRKLFIAIAIKYHFQTHCFYNQEIIIQKGYASTFLWRAAIALNACSPSRETEVECTL